VEVTGTAAVSVPPLFVTSPPSTVSVPTTTPLPAPISTDFLPTSAPTAFRGTFGATLDPYAGLGIEDLRLRSYGGGQIEQLEILAVNSYFTRTLMLYPSDGLSIYGFMNVPRRGTPPFPLVIAIHGYIEPEIYNTLDYTTGYADALAREGFIVLHPNLRGYPPSDDGENRFRVGMASDILNLIALVKAQAGKPGPLTLAAPGEVGLWGHSMGGGIATRVLTVSPDVKAAVLYGAMSGDERKNYERIFHYFSDGTRGQEELRASDEVLRRISPVYFFELIKASVSIHHGEEDADVPPVWSAETCRRLRDLGVQVECFTYPGQPHTFNGDGDALFVQRMVDFYKRNLKER
jgi:dipeptidyl aminopeptidase/acylaminoacyl peptidase